MAIADRINEMYNHVGDAYDILELAGTNLSNLFNENVEQGAIGSYVGNTYENSKEDSATRIRTVNLIQLDKTKSYTISVKSGYSFAIFTFNDEKKYYDGGHAIWSSNEITITNIPYIALSFKKSSEANIVPSEIDDIQVMLNEGTIALPYVKSVDKNLINLAPTWKERLLYFMNNGTDVVWNNWDKVTGEGTTLTLNNTEEAPMKIDLKGNTSQEGTPTPESPQDIHVVSGDNSINVTGKNLLSFANITNNTAVGITRTINQETITLNGTTTGAGNIVAKTSTGIILKAGTYTGSITTSGSYNRPNGDAAFYLRKDNTISGMFDKSLINMTTNGQYSSTFTLTEDTEVFLEIYTNASNITFDNYVCKFQIEKGSSATTYEPYIGNTYPINLPVENLLPNNAIAGTYSGITFTKNEDNTITLNGTATADTYINAWYNTTSNLVNNTSQVYTMSIGLSNSNVGLAIFEYINNSWVNKKYLYAESTTYTPSGNQTGQIFRVIVKNGATLNNVIVKPMLEVGTKANTYVPYGTTPIELCKIGDYQDSIVKDNGKWYLKKEIGKVVLNGSEPNWNVIASSNLYRAEKIFNILPYTDTSRHIGRFICSHFYPNTNNEIGVIFQYQSTLLFYVSSGITTVEQWKTWLGNNNTTLCYVLATPTYTEITDSTLLSQLNALAKSYTSQTNISQESNDLPFIINATALREME